MILAFPSKFQGILVLYKKNTFNAFEVTFLKAQVGKIEGMVRFWAFWNPEKYEIRPRILLIVRQAEANSW